jgi:hypothetical protein
LRQNGLSIYANSFTDNFGKANVEQVKKIFVKNILTKTAANFIVLQFGLITINLAYE